MTDSETNSIEPAWNHTSRIEHGAHTATSKDISSANREYEDQWTQKQEEFPGRKPDLRFKRHLLPETHDLLYKRSVKDSLYFTSLHPRH